MDAMSQDENGMGHLELEKSRAIFWDREFRKEKDQARSHEIDFGLF